MRRFFERYYLCNWAVLLTYVVLRVQRLDPGELGDKDFLGFTREASIYVSLALLLIARAFSAPTLDAYLATAFKGIAATLLLCLWFMDRTMFRYFGSIYLAVLLLCPQPRFQYPSSIHTLNHQSFASRITNNTHKTFYVVWAHATWSPRCTQLAPVFADLCRRLRHPRVQFAKLDVGRWGEAAKLLGVTVAATSKQLPTVIVYRQGKEWARIPKLVGEHGDIEHRWRSGFTAKDLYDVLKLEEVSEEAEKWEEAARKKQNLVKTKSGQVKKDD